MNKTTSRAATSNAATKIAATAAILSTIGPNQLANANAILDPVREAARLAVLAKQISKKKLGKKQEKSLSRTVKAVAATPSNAMLESLITGVAPIPVVTALAKKELTGSILLLKKWIARCRTGGKGLKAKEFNLLYNFLEKHQLVAGFSQSGPCNGKAVLDCVQLTFTDKGGALLEAIAQK